MKNHRHSCSWKSKHQSEGTRKNHQIPEPKITSAKVARSQRYSYTYCRLVLLEQLVRNLRTSKNHWNTHSYKFFAESIIARNSFHP